MDGMGSRILLDLSGLDRSRRFCRRVLGLVIDREFGPRDGLGVVFVPGPGTARGSAVTWPTLPGARR